MIPPIQSHRIPRAVNNLIKRSMVGILATSSKDAHPHPIMILYNYYPTEETLYFFILKMTKTFRYLCENPNVSVCIDQHDLFNPMRNFGVMLRGTVNHIKNDEVINRVLKDLLNKKYKTIPKDPQELKKNYKWFVPPYGQCFRLDITTMVWWRGPHFGRIRLQSQKA